PLLSIVSLCASVFYLATIALCPFFSYSCFFHDSALTYIYTLSLHDALPISCGSSPRWRGCRSGTCTGSPTWTTTSGSPWWSTWRSEEHTSELQSRFDLVCRLLLEKKNE